MTQSAMPSPVSPGRPRLVWVLFLLYTVIPGVALVAHLAGFSGLMSLGTTSMNAQLFFSGLHALNIVAATALWLLRKVAFPLLSLCLPLNIVATGARTWLPGGTYTHKFATDAMMVGAMVGDFLGVLVALGVWWYVYQLWRRGVLR